MKNRCREESYSHSLRPATPGQRGWGSFLICWTLKTTLKYWKPNNISILQRRAYQRTILAYRVYQRIVCIFYLRKNMNKAALSTSDVKCCTWIDVNSTKLKRHVCLIYCVLHSRRLLVWPVTPTSCSCSSLSSFIIAAHSGLNQLFQESVCKRTNGLARAKNNCLLYSLVHPALLVLILRRSLNKHSCLSLVCVPVLD